MTVYDIGDLAHLTASFANPQGAPTDPTTVTLTIASPSALTDITAALVHDDVGVYHYDLPITEAGLWRYRWVGTGDCQTAEESAFTVREPLAAAVDPIEAALAAAKAKLIERATGQMPIAVETPQLGRVVYQETSIADLQMLVDKLEALAHPETAYRLRRRPISIEACP